MLSRRLSQPSSDATRSQSTRHRDRQPGQAQTKRLIPSQQSQRRIASQKQRRIRKTLSNDESTLFGSRRDVRCDWRHRSCSCDFARRQRRRRRWGGRVAAGEGATSHGHRGQLRRGRDHYFGGRHGRRHARSVAHDGRVLKWVELFVLK